MSSLPRISGRRCVDALAKVGFSFVRQEGSPMIVRRIDPFAQITVPDHKERDRGTLRAIMRRAGLSVDEFVLLLGRLRR